MTDLWWSPEEGAGDTLRFLSEARTHRLVGHRLHRPLHLHQTARKKSSGKSSPNENPNSIEAIENGLDGYYRMLVDYDIISNQEYRLIYAMTHTMLEYCPESHRREAAKTMIHRIEWALKGE